MSAIPGHFVDGALTATDDAANSATLQMANGDQSLSGVVPDGRAAAKSESRGAVVGLRKGTRAYPQLSVSAIGAVAVDAFAKLIHGLTAGFTSVTADIGDYPAVDLSYTYDYGAESRSFTAQDCYLTDWSFDEGDPSNSVSMTFEILGPLTIDGETVISSR